MTSAISHHAQTSPDPSHLPAAASLTTLPSSGAVPAQHPVRSYATATKTATQATPAAAGASAQNAKSTESPVNGGNPMAQGGSQAANNPGVPNGMPAHAEHGRKPSVVISASGATGHIPNGGPVVQNGRPPINFGSWNAAQGSPLPQATVPHQTPSSSLPTPPRDPRVVSPAHSPSPIPQPQASGGRPPSSLQNQGNGLNFGSMVGGEGDPTRHGQTPSGPLGPGVPMHERRTSSQSMHSDAGNANMQNMNRNFPPNAGRGRGYSNQYGMPSPAQSYRQLPNQPRSGSAMPQFPQQAPNSPYNQSRGTGRGSPAPPGPPQPHMPQGHMGTNPQMQYGAYPQHMHQQQVYNMPQFDPYSGHYGPYGYYGQYPGQGQPQSPRPYPSPYNAQQAPMQPPFHPPNMSRSGSQSSQRPPSSLGQPQTPSLQHPPPQSQTPAQNQPAAQAPSSQFVRPVKKASVKITDAQGNEVNFGKVSPSPGAQVQSQAPVIVSTPSAPTPPPRASSSQHSRNESKVTSSKSAEETKNAFQEQVKRQMEEEKRRNDEAAAAKIKEEQTEAEPSKDREATASAVDDSIKPSIVGAEKAAATTANDEPGKADAQAAESASIKDASDGAKTPKEETEDERLDREIAEMEAAERAEEERERVFQEKKKKEKEAAAKLQAEKDATADEELKRQEREAEEREEAREREREAEAKTSADEQDDEAKLMFASLKKPTLGPGASAPDSGTETPASEDAASDSASMPPSGQDQATSQPRGAAAQKPKPAHLKLETTKRVEPAEPTPGMQALKSARFLELKEEPSYPDGFRSPNPALNVGGTRKGRAYDKDFLLQFQSVFKEKPSVDWDQKVKETLGAGDEPGSARTQSGNRTPSGMSRAPSGRPGAQAAPGFSGPMGTFGGQPIRTIPVGTTSEQRFLASQMGGGRGGMAIPGAVGRMPSNLGMGAPGAGISRTNSLQTMGNIGGPNSPRQPSSRGGRGGSKRGDRTMSKREEADAAAKMPLTAHMEVVPLGKSASGWKATSITAPAASAPDPSGHMAPDMVQRKVKAALNKMTPEKFDKISDQILEIAGQSKSESDGRTLRQVIQLTFEKACDEAHWAGMYAQFCHKMLTTMSSEIRDETIKDKNGNPVIGGALFRKYLLNRCQEEFERGWQANLPDKPEGDSQEAVLLSDEYYVAAAAKRRGLGLIQFIGQLYKLRMLTLRIMHECVLRLLNFEGAPDEAAVENLTTLLKAVGATMDEDDQGRNMMNAYFQRIHDVLLKSDALASRPRFMIMDLVDLRKASWKGKGDDSKGPKTLDQIHAEAAAAQARAEAERQRTSQRGAAGGRMPQGRGDARNVSGGMAPPVDYTRTTVGMDDLRRLQNRGTSQRQTGTGLGPGGNLGPGSMLGARSGSRRGNLGPPSSGTTTRTNTPPVGEKDKKDEPSTQTNAFSALASLDASGEGPEDVAAQSEAASPPSARNRSKSPMPGEKGEESSNA